MRGPRTAARVRPHPRYDTQTRPIEDRQHLTGMGWTSALPLAVRIRMQRIKPSTQRQYGYAFGHFAQWLDTKQQLPRGLSAPVLDAQLEAFAEWLFVEFDGARRQTASCARLACIWLCPALKRALPRSLAVTNLTAWNRAADRVVRSHPPIPWPLLCVVAHRFSAAGDHAMGAAVILSFCGLLRVGEVADLKVHSIAEQRGVDARLGDGLVVTIERAKTADPRLGQRQSVVVSDPVAVAVVRDYLALRRAAARPTDSLFGRSRHGLETAFTGAAAALGGACHYTWHSLRHGGATFLAMSGVRVEDICIAGRWLSLAGVRRYIQTGQAVVAAHGVDPRIVAEGEALAAALRHVSAAGQAAV
jgi:hypothetical protein